MSFATLQNVYSAYQISERTEMLGLPIWPFRLSISVGLLVLSLRLVIQFFEKIAVHGKDATDDVSE
jgi:TRAP-type mannitol/chloroaromatic compound transport system permease small subunit